MCPARLLKLLVLLLLAPAAPAQEPSPAPVDAAWVEHHYYKREVRVPMRDGKRLFTAVYTPKSPGRRFPILMLRTPYSVRPYGEEEFRSSLGPSPLFTRAGYIFVYQDVRGCYLSEGEFVNVRPHVESKTSPEDVDESSDTYDTIEWLLANVPNHNGKVGMWGISYPGFYAAAGMIDAHPALAAVSPQAPIADWFFDDFHHHGALFLAHAFNFLSTFGLPRPEPTTERHPRFDHGTPDGYQFFLDMGPIPNADRLHLQGRVAFWEELCAHPSYDAFWQARNILPHLDGVAPAVMTVGGWFDAEDLYGPLKIYGEVERRNPDAFNVLVMGPWRHGGWARTDGDRLGGVHFGAKTSLWYREHVELPFFEHFLRGEGALELAEATVFETGTNRWRSFPDWPPAAARARSLYLRYDRSISREPPGGGGEAWAEFTSDPDRPVPFTEAIATGMTREYMTDDQRFAARRPDVLTFQTEVLAEDLTLAGPVAADLWVSTSAEDADWVVKLVDVFPPDARQPEEMGAEARPLGGYQMMVRSEVLRGRFRESYEHPRPFVPGEPTRVRVELLDVLHTFREGHRLMVQIQSTWFPLVDRNPQGWVDNVYEAREEDFQSAVHRVYVSRRHPSALRISVLAE